METASSRTHTHTFMVEGRKACPRLKRMKGEGVGRRTLLPLPVSAEV